MPLTNLIRVGATGSTGCPRSVVGVNLVLCNWQKCNDKENNIIQSTLELISNTTMGQLGVCQGFWADQLHSAVDLESPLRPVTLKHPPCLMTPSTTEPLTLKPLNWNSRGEIGRGRKDEEVGELKATPLLVCPSSLLLYWAQKCVFMLREFESFYGMHMKQMRTPHTRGACEEKRVACAAGDVTLAPILPPPFFFHPILLTSSNFSLQAIQFQWRTCSDRISP